MFAILDIEIVVDRTSGGQNQHILMPKFDCRVQNFKVSRWYTAEEVYFGVLPEQKGYMIKTSSLPIFFPSPDSPLVSTSSLFLYSTTASFLINI